MSAISRYQLKQEELHPEYTECEIEPSDEEKLLSADPAFSEYMKSVEEYNTEYEVSHDKEISI